MPSQGYGIYQGVGGLPYQVGGSGMDPYQSFGSRETESAAAPMGEATTSNPAAAPGAQGSSIYGAGLPQWMQDYFDVNLAGQGFKSLNDQRNLMTNVLPQLQQQYGNQAAMNPYFTSAEYAKYNPNLQKGFDPFSNAVWTSETQNGRWGEYNPHFTYDKTVKTTRNPFTGEAMGTDTSYQQTYGSPTQYSTQYFDPKGYATGFGVGTALNPAWGNEAGLIGGLF